MILLHPMRFDSMQLRVLLRWWYIVVTPMLWMFIGNCTSWYQASEFWNRSASFLSKVTCGLSRCILWRDRQARHARLVNDNQGMMFLPFNFDLCLAQDSKSQFEPEALRFGERFAAELLRQKSPKVVAKDFEGNIWLGRYVELDLAVDGCRIGNQLE